MTIPRWARARVAVAHVVKAGAILAERYRLERPLGRGGMGEVWAGTHVVTLAPVAVKLLSASVTGGGQGRRRFLQEAQAPAALDHPNVIRVIDAFVLDDGQPAIVMDRLEGEPLNAIFGREEVLPKGALAALAAPVLDAVAAAHAKGLVHRDLKPGNLFLARRAGRVIPMVLDFGLVKLMGSSRTALKTQPGVALGTPAYMAPEQARGGELGPAADVWAMGVVLYRGLSGMLPIEGDGIADLVLRLHQQAILPLEEVEPDLPPDLTALVMAMLSKEAVARPSAAEAASRLWVHAEAAALEGYVRARSAAVTAPELPSAQLPTAPTVAARTATAPALAVSSPPAPTVPMGLPGPRVGRGVVRRPIAQRRWCLVAVVIVVVVVIVVAAARRGRSRAADEATKPSTKPGLRRATAEGRPLRTGPLAPAGLYLWREADGTWALRAVGRRRRRGSIRGRLEGLASRPVSVDGEKADAVTEEGEAWRFVLELSEVDSLDLKADDCITVDLDSTLPLQRIYLGRDLRHPEGRRFTVCPP